MNTLVRFARSRGTLDATNLYRIASVLLRFAENRLIDIAGEITALERLRARTGLFARRRMQRALRSTMLNHCQNCRFGTRNSQSCEPIGWPVVERCQPTRLDAPCRDVCTGKHLTRHVVIA